MRATADQATLAPPAAGEPGPASPAGVGRRLLTAATALVITAAGTGLAVSTFRTAQKSPSGGAPPNGLLAFVHGVRGDVWTVRPDGSDLTRVPLEVPGGVVQVAWSPDGRRFALEVQDQPTAAGRFDIFVVNADGTDLRRLTNDGASRMPAWSPDGSRIAYVRQEGSASHLFVMRPDGTRASQITSGEGFDVSPAWSPDGSGIAFARMSRGESDIYVVNGDGGEEVRLTDDPGWEGDPEWSPDGERIAFVAERPEPGIYSVALDGPSRNLLVPAEGPGDAQNTHLSWSPDGQTLAFSSPRGPGWERALYLLDVASGKVRQITERRDSIWGPAWRSPGEQPAAVGLPEGQLYLRTDGGAGVLRVGDGQLATLGARGLAYDVSTDGRLLVAQGDALVSVSPETGQRMVLFEAEPSDELQALARWAPGGMSAAFSVGAHDPSVRSTMCVAEFPPDEPRCFPEAGRVYTFDWAPDGRAIVLAGPPSEPVRAVDPATGAISEVVPQQGLSPVNTALREAGLGEAMQLVDPTWSPSGRYLAALANLERSRFAYVPVVLTREGDVVALGRPSTEFPEPLSWSPVSDVLAYTWGMGPYHIRDLRLLDPATGEDRLLFSLDDGGASPSIDEPIPTITDVAWAPSGRWLAVTTWEGTERLLIVDVEGEEQPRRIEGTWEVPGPILGWTP